MVKEEAFLRQEVEAAGFKLVAEGNFLRNPNDPRDQDLGLKARQMAGSVSRNGPPMRSMQ